MNFQRAQSNRRRAGTRAAIVALGMISFAASALLPATGEASSHPTRTRVDCEASLYATTTTRLSECLLVTVELRQQAGLMVPVITARMEASQTYPGVLEMHTWRTEVFQEKLETKWCSWLAGGNGCSVSIQLDGYACPGPTGLKKVDYFVRTGAGVERFRLPIPEYFLTQGSRIDPCTGDFDD